MTTSTTGDAAAAALPLDWTRLGRGRGDVEAGPCPDVLCNGCLPPSSTDEQLQDGEVVSIHGTAVLCLPDADNDWFQGYFFPSNSSPEDEKSNKNVYKLLCVQQDDADPCLHCDDYQLWTVTVYYYEYYHHPTATTKDQPRQQTKKLTCTFRNVVSRGGDSIRWHHSRIRFAAATVATGRKAHGLVERYFAGLLRTLQDDEPDDEAGSDDGNGGGKTSGVAAVMPNVAVVTGDMTIWLPARQ